MSDGNLCRMKGDWLRGYSHNAPKRRPFSLCLTAPFQVHGVDATGEVVLRWRLTGVRLTQFFTKLAPCFVGIEACATSHHWARELLKTGHDVRLMPPSYLRP
jgi:hypothetical protein